MPLFFNTVIESNGINPKEVRLLRHKDNRADKGKSPYELWRDDRISYELYQSTQNIKNRAKLEGKYWASFVGTPNNETLFTGIYKNNGRSIITTE